MALLYLINDSEVLISSREIKCSAGGSAAHIAGFAATLRNQNMEFGMIGNFRSNDANNNLIHFFRSSSNAGFIVKLMTFFLFHRFKKDDVLYFQRPDHASTAYFTKARIIVHLHGQQKTIVDRRRGLIPRFIYHLMEIRSMKIASKVIATDSITSDIYRAAYPFINEKLTVIPTGIDTDYFKPPRVPVTFRDLPVNSKLLVYIGRLSYPKRVDQIIRAFNLLARKDSAACLVIAGNGKDIESLKKLASDSPAFSRILFIGELSKDDIVRLLQATRLAILLSHSEGSPISLKECLACGVPVIVNDVGDVKEYIIPGETGLFVNADNTEEITGAMFELIANHTRYKECCRKVALNYQQSKLNQQILEIIG